MQTENIPPNPAIPSAKYLLPNVVSIEEFEAEQLAAIAARAQARSQTQTPKKPTPSTTHNAQPGPIPLGAPRKSEFVPKFTHLCQTKGVVPEYEYFTPGGGPAEQRVPKGQLGGGGPGFGARVRVAGEVVETDGFWARKQDAKERVAELAMGVVEGMEGARKKERSEGGKVENWIGMLNEYTQATGQPAPEFQIFTLGLHFSCEVTLSSLPTQPLGDRHTPQPTKKAARASAASAAIAHLRETGQYTAALARKKKFPLSPTPSPLDSPLDSPIPEGVDVGPTAVAQCIQLAPVLNLSPPQYTLTKVDPKFGAFYDCYASFPDNPKIPTEIGKVERVYGQKNAKEECARGVLGFLKELEEERQMRLQSSLARGGIVAS